MILPGNTVMGPGPFSEGIGLAEGCTAIVWCFFGVLAMLVGFARGKSLTSIFSCFFLGPLGFFYMLIPVEHIDLSSHFSGEGRWNSRNTRSTNRCVFCGRPIGLDTAICAHCEHKINLERNDSSK